MDPGRQCAYTGVRSLPVEEHVKTREKLDISLWVIGFEQDSSGSEVWVSILVRIDPFERAINYMNLG